MHTDKGGSSVGFDAQLHPVYRKVRRTVSWRRPCASDLLRFGKCIWGASNLLFFCKRDAATSSELGLWNRICKSQPTILPRTLFVSHWALMKEFLRHSALWGIAALYLRNCTVWPFSSKFSCHRVNSQLWILLSHVDPTFTVTLWQWSCWRSSFLLQVAEDTTGSMRWHTSLVCSINISVTELLS